MRPTTVVHKGKESIEAVGNVLDCAAHTRQQHAAVPGEIARHRCRLLGGDNCNAQTQLLPPIPTPTPTPT